MKEIRNNFETWCATNNDAPKNLTRNGRVYLCRETQIAWLNWISDNEAKL